MLYRAALYAELASISERLTEISRELSALVMIGVLLEEIIYSVDSSAAEFSDRINSKAKRLAECLDGAIEPGSSFYEAGTDKGADDDNVKDAISAVKNEKSRISSDVESLKTEAAALRERAGEISALISAGEFAEEIENEIPY